MINFVIRTLLFQTTPIENILCINNFAFDKFCKEFIQLNSFLHDNHVKHHKEKLGKHNSMFTGEYKYYVWDSPSWRVYVSNKRGTSFEVISKASEKEAILAWEDYKEKIGFTNYAE